MTLGNGNITDFIVGLGRSPEHATIIRKYGYNLDINDTEEDVVSQGGSLVYPAAPGELSLTYSGNDVAGGSHAQKVGIYRKDDDFKEVYTEHDLTADGSPLSLGITGWGVDRMRVARVGTRGNTNENAIQVSIGGNVQCEIPVGKGQSQKAAYSIPSDHGDTYLYRAIFTVDSTKSADFELWARPKANDADNPEAWLSKYSAFGLDGGAPHVIPFDGSVNFQGATDLRWEAVSSAGAGAKVSVDFTLVMFRTDKPVHWP